MRELQVLLSIPPQPPLVAGVPGVLRTAHDLVDGEKVRQIILYTRSGDFVELWQRCLTPLPWTEARGATLDPNCTVLVVAPDGIPYIASLRGFLRESESRGKPTAWEWNGTVVAACYPDASGLPRRRAPQSPEFLADALADPYATRLSAPPAAWENVRAPDGLKRAEDRLFRSLRRESDGYLARLDRTLSIALSRFLIRTPVTPNAITTVSLVVGLAGAALLASPRYWVALAGAALLWSCCILDGCDGEVARLTLRCSPFGARFDVIADNIVHIAIFVAIPVHLARVHGSTNIWSPAITLMAGVLLSTFSVWWLILRRPEEERARRQRLYERIASRDFIYLVFVLAVIEHLDWFLWSAAIGANVFWLSLWVVL